MLFEEDRIGPGNPFGTLKQESAEQHARYEISKDVCRQTWKNIVKNIDE